MLLLQRSDVKDQFSGAWVFPGGVVDPGDREAHALCGDFNDRAASQRLGLDEGGLDLYVAAIRECFEETGILLAQIDPVRGTVSESAMPFNELRATLRREEMTFSEACGKAKLRLLAGELAYFNHWITPKGLPKRFDTRFFVAAAPENQLAQHDGIEMVAHMWIEPAAALAQVPALKLMHATGSVLRCIADFENIAALMSWAKGLGPIPLILPRFAMGHSGRKAVLPNESAWAEIGLLDPEGNGTARDELQSGQPIRLTERLIRVTANNGGEMTGAGTNSYLVGGGPRNEWAIVDPGPLDPNHVQALLAAAPGPIRWILATHTHMDHSPATVLLKDVTGAAVYGRRPDHTEWQDLTFVPDHELVGGERLTLCEGLTLRTIHTPGHASNHLCYLIEEDKVLITGDHIVQGSTVVINPPDGDMSAYLDSLSALLHEDLQWLAPGHGFLMAEPAKVIRWIIAHRQQREAKIVAAVRKVEAATLDELLPGVYDDVPASRHPMARRSLRAHLLKLRNEGTAVEHEGRWSLSYP